MRVAIVIASLACGGAERVTQLLARGFLRDGNEVMLITTTRREDFFPQPEGVKRIRLDLLGAAPGAGLRAHFRPAGLMRGIRSLRILRDTIAGSRPDVVISMMDQVNVVVLLSLVGTATPVVVTEHSDPAARRLAGPWRLLRRVTYPRAAALVSVSAGVDRHFEWMPATRRAVIGNPVVVDGPITARSGLPRPLRDAPFLAAMGRLAPVKGFDLLIECFGRLPAELDRWQLAILGEGAQLERLRSLARAAGVADRVHFLGARTDPRSILQHAELLAVSSRWEGFGNAIVEAMACGLPVVSFDCPSGPGEIVRHGVDGILVPPGDRSAFAAALAELMRGPKLRRSMAFQARRRAADFALEKIVGRWSELLREVARRA